MEYLSFFSLRERRIERTTLLCVPKTDIFMEPLRFGTRFHNHNKLELTMKKMLRTLNTHVLFAQRRQSDALLLKARSLPALMHKKKGPGNNTCHRPPD